MGSLSAFTLPDRFFPRTAIDYSTTAIASIENNSPLGRATTGVDRTGGDPGKNSVNSSFSFEKASASATKHVTFTTRCRPVPASSSTARRLAKA